MASSVSHFEVGTWVWIPHAVDKALPAQVKSAFSRESKSALVQTEDGEERTLEEADIKLVTECNPEIINSQKIDDLVDLSDLNENSILHNLRNRYKSDAIYTNISSILISVNPFKLLPIYTSAILEEYRSGYHGKPPHVYGVAFNSYRDMLKNDVSQSVVISGESGAGKSEATKLILQFLTDVSARNSNPDQAPVHTTADVSPSSLLQPEELKAARRKSLIVTERISTLEQQILAANPILEAFGNAKTLRNNNSSRFGKLITIDFDKVGSIVGGEVITYLLEKTRIVSQTQGERNYHVFYQLLSQATNPRMAEELRLKSPELFSYTALSGVTKIEGKSDEFDFEEVQNSFKILRFSEEDRREIYRLVAGVLHFGNVKFRVEKNSTGDDGSSIVDAEVADLAASLWCVDPVNIKKYLVGRDVGSAKESYYVAYNVQQAADARDAMVKRVYSELFSLIVEKINSTLSTGIPKHRFIGVLDIFGFESFEVNSFEQLCINFCNEKLQFHFNEHIFKMEQTLYQAEGIVLPGTAFVDNQPTLDLLELKSTGIFSMIDEEINVPRGSDEGFLSKLYQKHEKTHPNLIRPKAKDCKDFLKNFGINHYAGPVFYNVSNFLEKNRDSLHPNIITSLKESKSHLFASFFKESASLSLSTSGGGAVGSDKLKSIIQSKVIGSSNPPLPTLKISSSAMQKAKTLGNQFKDQLNELMKTLNSTCPHFIRCVKPNDQKTGNNFNASRIMDQLRYAGIVEVCRIRKLGYPDRKTFAEFFSRYTLLDKRALTTKSRNMKELTDFLAAEGVLKAGDWAIGNTKVFMKQVQTLELESKRDQSLWGVATFLQKYVRGTVYKWRYTRKYKTILRELRENMAKRDRIGLSKAVENTAELPYCSGNKKRKKELQIIVDSKKLIERLQKEEQITRQLEEAIKAKDLTVLQNAVKAHADIQPFFDTPLIITAKAIIARIELEQALMRKLKEAIAKRNLELLDTYLQEAQSHNLVCTEVNDAKSLKERIEKENDLLEKLAVATATENLDAISLIYQQCLDLNLNDRPQVKDADQKMKEIVAKKEAAERAAEEERQRRAREEAEAKRQKAIRDATDKLNAAKSKKNLDALAIAIKEANELNENNSEFIGLINECQKLSNLVKLSEDFTNKLTMCMNVLTDKESNGVTSQDVNNLNTILEDCKTSNISEKDCPMQAHARDYIVKYSNQVKILDELKIAVENNSLDLLRNAVGNAENAKLSTDLVKKAQENLRELEIKDRAERAKSATVPLPKIPPATIPKDPATPMQGPAPTSVKTEEKKSVVGPITSASSTTTTAQSSVVSSPAPVDDPKEILAQLNLKRQQVAMQTKYEFSNFPRLRSLDDFARGAILNKTKIKEGMLLFQTNSIPKSLLDLPKDLNKMAIDIHKDLMCYMGDKSAPFPTTLAQDILRKGFDYPDLRDEIYALIIKQLTNNQKAESIAKGWQMMCMCVGTFPPSYDGENYLLHYILEKRDKSKGAIVDYAKYCLRTLESMLNNGDGTGFVPNVEEILAYKERPPILASIYLVDGSFIAEDLPITPDLNVGKILEMCYGWLDLKDPRCQRLGMFVYDLGSVDGTNSKDQMINPYDDLDRTPRPLRNEDYMGDVIVQKARQRRKYKFVVKQKIFLQSETTRGDDPFFERMVYLQAEDEVIIQGNVQIEDEGDVPILAAISMTVAFGPELGHTSEEILSQGVIDFVVPSWRDQFSAEEWASAVQSYRGDLEIHQPEDLQEHFLQIVYKSPQYGMHWFYVHMSRYTDKQLVPPAIRKLSNSEKSIILGFNSEGVHIYRTNHKYELSYVYADIFRWGGSANNFSLVVSDETIPESFELIVITSQAADMAAIILDYIKAIMETSIDDDDE